MKTKEEFKKIILAVDGSDASKKAAKKALFLAKKTGIDVTAIHVIHVPVPTVPPARIAMGSVITDYSFHTELKKTMKEKGESIINEIKEIAASMQVNVKTKIVEGIPDDEIIKFANKNDLIIMGGKGHSTLDRILVGSISEKVLHHSNSTVMIVR
jgi:nucleotide-binding universal stress UspA family protein